MMPSPSPIRLTADPAIFTRYAGELRILLAKRPREPFADKWQLPGMPIDATGSSIETQLQHRLCAQLQAPAIHLEQIIAVSGRLRDPRGYAISHLYLGVIRASACTLNRVPNSPELAWFSMDALARATLAFDHNDLVKLAHTRLLNRSYNSVLPALMLEAEFTIPDLERLYSDLIGTPTPNATLRRRLADKTSPETTGHSANPWVTKTSLSRKDYSRDTALYRLAGGALEKTFPANLNYHGSGRGGNHGTS